MSRPKQERKDKIKYKTIGGKKDGVVIGSKAKEAKADEQSKRLTAAERRKEHKDRFVASGAIPGQKLIFPKKNGFHRRLVNDEFGRVENHLDRGYTNAVLTEKELKLATASDNGGCTRKRVGVKQDGSALYGYLMEIPMDFHIQDRQENIDKITNEKAREELRGGSMQNPDQRIWSGEVQFK